MPILARFRPILARSSPWAWNYPILNFPLTNNLWEILTDDKIRSHLPKRQKFRLKTRVARARKGRPFDRRMGQNGLARWACGPTIHHRKDNL